MRFTDNTQDFSVRIKKNEKQASRFICSRKTTTFCTRNRLTGEPADPGGPRAPIGPYKRENNILN